MYGHLTCPEIFWHVSDKRIGTISNPAGSPMTVPLPPSHKVIFRKLIDPVSACNILHVSVKYICIDNSEFGNYNN